MVKKTVTLDIKDWVNICNWLSNHKDRDVYQEGYENEEEIRDYEETETSINKLNKKIYG